MKFCQEMLCSFLQAYKISTEIVEDAWDIEQVLLSEGQFEDESGIMYVSAGSDGDVQCRCTGGCIRVQGASVAQVFNKLLGGMTYYNEWERRATDAIARAMSPEYCLTLISELFPGHTVKLLDPLGRVLFVDGQRHIEALEPVIITLFRNIPACHRISLGIPGVTMFWSEHFKQNYIIANIVFSEGVYLIFSVGQIDSDKDKYLMHLAKLAQDLFRHMDYRTLDTIGLTPYRNFLLRLLDGRTVREEDFERLESYLGWKISSGGRLVLMPKKNDDAFAGRALPLAISGKLSRTLSFSDEKYVLCLLPEERLSSGLTVLEDVMRSTGYRAGLSLCFYNWAQLPSAYKQAELALNAVGKNGELINSCENEMWPYIINILKEAAGPELIHPDCYKILSADQGSQSQLMETLRSYLKNNCSMTKTAEALHIHISTLKYRMSRINELISLRPNDYKWRMHFLLSCDLLETGIK